MRIRNITFITILILEIAFILYLAIKKGNHTLPGYIALGLTVVLFIFTGWLALFPKMIEIAPTGEYKINYVEEYYTDDSRKEYYNDNKTNRELAIGVWYPKEKQDKMPLVIFSHGSFGTIDNNKTLCTELASRGYIVVSISHTYQAFETRLADGKKVKISSEFMNEILNDNPKKDINKSFEHFKKWMDLRTKDISFILDSILEQNNHCIYKNIDKEKIIVMGHSMGGNAALGMPRLRDDIKAVVALESSFMCDIIGVENNDFVYINEEYPVPVLNVYSDSSYNSLKDWKQYRRNYELLNTNDPKYRNVYFEGIGHMHLCDFQLESPLLSWILSGKESKYKAEENLKRINEVVLSFLQDNNL